MAPKAAPAAAKAGAKAKPEAKKAAAPKKEKEEPRPEDLIPKVEAPNNDEFQARLDAVAAEIDKLQEQQKDLAKRISERSGGKDEYQQKRAELRAELDHWSGLLDGIRGQKSEISAQLGEKKAEGLAQKDQLNKMKKSIGFTSETEIDERIASIEFKLWTESVPLKDEKKMLAEIQQLKKDRPKVAGIKSMEAGLASGDKGQSLREQSKSLSERMGQYLEEKRKVSEKLKELNEQRKNETGDLPVLIEERETLSTKIRELSGKRNQIRAEKREQEQAFYVYQGELRKIRQERAAQERNMRQKEYEDRKKIKEAEKLDDQPHTQEITLIEQTIAFCQKLTKEKATEEDKEEKEISHANMDGCEVMVNKKDRDAADYVFVNPKGKKGKKAAKAVSSSKAIKHSAETFQLFSKLGLDAPITTADVPDLMEKLEAQLVDYKAKVSEWEEKKEELKRKILEGTNEEEEKAEEEKADE